MTKQVWMPIGLPGIGKSTYLNQALAGSPHRRISPDDIREELTGDMSNLSRDKEVFQLARDRFETALQSQAPADQTIILDATFLNPNARQKFLDLLIAASQQIFLRVFTFPMDVNLALTRQKNRARQVPEAAIRRLANSYKPFTAAEVPGVAFDHTQILPDGSGVPVV